MTDPELRLVDPTETLMAEYLVYVRSFSEAGEDRPGPAGDELLALIQTAVQNGEDPKAIFAAHIRDWHSAKTDVLRPDGRYPMRIFWMLRDQCIVGTCALRLRLNEAALDRGGNAGYEVRPGERRKGYATWMCQQMMARARTHELDRLWLTCAADNGGSIAVIEACGGVLDSESPNQDNGVLTRRYWIELQ